MPAKTSEAGGKTLHRITWGAAMCAFLLSWATPGVAKPPPLSIEELRTLRSSAPLKFVRKLDDGAGYTAQLMSFKSAGLAVHALVAVPATDPPAGGYPVLVANHGFHPQPERYGITEGGIDSRPGDYYRAVPAMYAQAGFMVVMPDYRGHNISEGREFTAGLLATGYYTEDVAALLAAIPSLPNADARQIFLWGHSLGGEVSLRALLATQTVKGASLWSSVGGDIWDQAYYYSRYQSLDDEDSAQVPKPAFEALRKDIRDLGVPYDWRKREPLLHLQYLSAPIAIHHAIGDAGADYRWSLRLAKELYLQGHPYVFYSYPGEDHFFKGRQLHQAVERDVRFFRGLMAPQASIPP